MSYTLIIKEPNAQVIAYSNHIKVKTKNSLKIFAYRHLRSIFINQMVDISLISCKKISQKIDLYVIDTKGYIILEIRSTKDEEI